MATMIPSHIRDDKTSPAEQRVFDMFGEDPEAEGWIVFHSLGLSQRRPVPTQKSILSL